MLKPPFYESIHFTCLTLFHCYWRRCDFFSGKFVLLSKFWPLSNAVMLVAAMISISAVDEEERQIDLLSMHQ